MRILFVHQNFPGQFLHLAPELRERGHEVLAMTVESNARPSPVPVVKYRYDGKSEPALPRLVADFYERVHRGETVAQGAAELRRRTGYVPDVVFAHLGWGESLYLKDVWPEARLIVYAEFCYGPRGLDTDFDPEIQRVTLPTSVYVRTRQAHLLLAISAADAALAPTRWQASSFPPGLREGITVIHDGIDTARVCPNPAATFAIPGSGPGSGQMLKAGDEVLTFVNRNLEPYRGYHIFMRALPDILLARKEAQVVIVGGDGVSYGTRPPGEKSWKAMFLDEVAGRLDLERVHFVGNVDYASFIALMQVSRVHAYLTYPFVLSWSMLEAMSAGALVVASRTPPVEEVIKDGVNGRLVDFFDVKGWSAALSEVLAEPGRFMGLCNAARETIIERYDLRTRCLPDMVRFVEGS
jgi:glycosyltransferase involved in cell wall biosynthesis